jgi:hypothetical protein
MDSSFSMDKARIHCQTREKSRGTRGRPALSRSQETLEYLAKLSEPYGVSIDIEKGVGTIRL